MEDFLEKTEPPTAKRIADARRKGQVAKSQDFTIGILLLVNMLVMLFFSRFMYLQLRNITVNLFSNLDFDYTDPEIITYWLRLGLAEIMYILSPMFLTVIFVAILVNMVQFGFVFSLHPMAPKWKKLNFFNGSNYKRYFSFQTLLKLALGQLRFFIVVIASWTIVGKDMMNVYKLTNGTPQAILLFIFNKSMQVGIFLATSFLAISLIDLFYQKWKFHEDLKMTRREIKDEVKLREGDAQMKAKIREALRKLLQNQVQRHVPNASVIITEATQAQAIALLYQPSRMSAPICVARGARQKAREILDIASKYQVPVVENSPLAKALYQTTDIGEMIPKSYYFDVATAISQARKIKMEAELSAATPSDWTRPHA